MSEENFNLKTKVTVSGSFTPKKAGKKAKVKTRTKAVRKPEKAEPLKALTVEGKKEESRPGTRTGKKEKKQKKRFSPPLPLSKFLPMSLKK